VTFTGVCRCHIAAVFMKYDDVVMMAISTKNLEVIELVIDQI